MGSWMLAGVVGVALLVLVIVALYQAGSTAPAGDDDGTDTHPGAPGAPATPTTLAPPPFRLTWQGYDPEQVDAYVARITAAYERLWTRHTTAGTATSGSSAMPRTPVPPVDPPAATRGPVILPKIRAESDEGHSQDG